MGCYCDICVANNIYVTRLYINIFAEMKKHEPNNRQMFGILEANLVL